MTAARDFEQEGYAVFRGGLDVTELQRIEQEVVQPFPGPLYRHNLSMTRHSEVDLEAPLDLSGLLDAHLWELPDLRPFSQALRTILFSGAIYDALHEIDGETRYTLHQSIFFFRSTRIFPHFDNSTLDTEPAARSFTLWVAVDAASPLNGPTYVVPTPRGKYWTRPETTPPGTNPLMHQWLHNSMPPTKVMLTMNAGDFAVWAPTTPHGAMIAQPGVSARRSIQAMYRPTRILNWGNTRASLADTHDPKYEEEEINGRFNCLISKRGNIIENFRHAG
jgi:hypothetical protein